MATFLTQMDAVGARCGAVSAILRRPWGLVGPLILGVAFEMSEAGLLPNVFPAIQAGLGLPGADLGIIVAANKLAGGLFSLFWIWMAGSWSRKGVLVVGVGLASILSLMMGAANGFVALLVLSCTLTSLSGGAVTITTSILADIVEDRRRGRAIGIMYASNSLLGAASGALIGRLLGFEEGWRLGYWALGGLGIAAALLILLSFDDPTAAVSDPLPRRAGTATPKLTAAAAMTVFRIPSFMIMLLSRLLSGHLVIASFGILFLTSVRHFSNEASTLVLLPYGMGLCLGFIGGGIAVDRLNATWPLMGRVAFLQAAQFAFAAVAFFATQVAWTGIGTYMAFWLALGFLQGINPGVNRPIVLAVVPRELRTWALFIMLSIVEPIGWASYSIVLSVFSQPEELRTALLVILVGIMILNGLTITPLYQTYRRDSWRAQALDAEQAVMMRQDG